jgi:hypothetical protein
VLTLRGSVARRQTPPRPLRVGCISELQDSRVGHYATFQSPLAILSSLLTTFRINTCISVASKRLYLPLESILMKKPGEGEGHPSVTGSVSVRLSRPYLLTKHENCEGPYPTPPPMFSRSAHSAGVTSQISWICSFQGAYAMNLRKSILRLRPPGERSRAA